MLELASEDSLRLNVLITQDVKAIRINESNMILYARLPDKEIKIQLHPTFNEERYLRQVKELLASKYLDSPAGFPVFMSRWTRMQQSGKQNLDALLKIGEPEAVVYTVNSPDLNAEQAKYAWWAIPSTEVAIELLKKPAVVNSELSAELREFLLEFLPFETDSNLIISAVHLLVSNDLLTKQQKKSLLNKGKRKAHFLIGFLHCDCNIVPGESSEHPQYASLEELSLIDATLFNQLQILLSPAGQNYLNILVTALKKFTDQESIIALFQTMQHFFQLSESPISTDIAKLSIMELIEAIQYLSNVHENQLNETLSRTNAVGSVLRKQLQPLTQPIIQHVESLLK